MSFESETMHEVTTGLVPGGRYSDIVPLRKTRRFQLYTAIKAGKRFILKTPADGSGEGLSLLKREYAMSLSISHHGIAYVFTYEEDSPVGPCIVMEHVDGTSLDAWLATGPSEKRRKDIFRQMLDAVEYIHSRGVVHNDLSPQNILVTRDGERVKIIDFGYSDDGSYVTDKSLGGTIGYASPELRAGADVDARSDIWSIGRLATDIFGSRYRRLWRKCTRNSPDGRYNNIAALRKAWERYYIPLRLSVAAVLIAAIAVPATGYYKEHQEMKAEFLKARQELEAKENALAGPKARLDAFYANEVASARTGMVNEQDTYKKAEIYNALMSEYADLNISLMTSIPMEYRPDFMMYEATNYEGVLDGLSALITGIRNP